MRTYREKVNRARQVDIVELAMTMSKDYDDLFSEINGKIRLTSSENKATNPALGLVIDPLRNAFMWYCSGRGGDPIDYVQQKYDYSCDRAVKLLNTWLDSSRVKAVERFVPEPQPVSIQVDVGTYGNGIHSYTGTGNTLILLSDSTDVVSMNMLEQINGMDFTECHKMNIAQNNLAPVHQYLQQHSEIDTIRLSLCDYVHGHGFDKMAHQSFQDQGYAVDRLLSPVREVTLAERMVMRNKEAQFRNDLIHYSDHYQMIDTGQNSFDDIRILAYSDKFPDQPYAVICDPYCEGTTIRFHSNQDLAIIDFNQSVCASDVTDERRLDASINQLKEHQGSNEQDWDMEMD